MSAEPLFREGVFSTFSEAIHSHSPIPKSWPVWGPGLTWEVVTQRVKRPMHGAFLAILMPGGADLVTQPPRLSC